MGQDSILTKKQKDILDEISRYKEISQRFYFTGGTALSEIFLKHRYSDDLDFFTPDKFETQSIFNFLNQLSVKNNFRVQTQFIDPVYICNLTFKDGDILKLDFGLYPYKQLEKTEKYLNLRVDSLVDLAVNKVLTVTQRTQVKDFVDLYFLLEKFTISELICGVKQKFNFEIEPLILASNFTLAEDFKFMPRMIKPLSLNNFKKFFIDKAKSLGLKSIQK